MATRVVHLHKRCPVCGGIALAEGKLPGFPGTRPPVFDLEDPDRLIARHSLGILLALVELVPYKEFECESCGYGFRLANETAKTLAVGMLKAMQPVPSDRRLRANPPDAILTLPRPRVSRGRRKKAASDELVPLVVPDTPRPAPPAEVAEVPDWEPEGLD